MSLSDALGPYPVVHHFYPIDPATASQQQSAVYNGPFSPLVAPIIPIPPQQTQPRRKKAPKRRLEEEDTEIEEMPAGPSKRVKRRKSQSQQQGVGVSQELEPEVMILPAPVESSKQLEQQDSQSQQYEGGSSSTQPAAHGRQSMAYIEITVPKSFDRDLYKPITLSSLGRGQRERRTLVLPRFSPLTEFTPTPTPTLSAASDKSYDPDSDTPFLFKEPVEVRANARGRRGGEGISEPQAARVPALKQEPEDDATTCHQCRRKTTNEKMRCRRLRPDGIVCTFMFCMTCIEVRYDEEFDSFHPNWHCPRCRGICNCSICLRKAGLGYILDGAAAEELTGAPGRLSRANRKVKGKAKAKAGQGRQQLSVRAWLARRGIALGTEEWMEERRSQGVRFVVGMSPPPLDRPSPYKAAELNAYLAACEEDVEDSEDDDIGFPLDPVLKGEGGIAPPMALLEEGSGASSSQRTGVEARPSTVYRIGNTPIIPATPYASSSQLPQGPPLPQVPVSNPYADMEDLLGQSSAQSSHVKLIVGDRRPRPGEKKRSTVPKIKKPQKEKLKKKEDLYESDDEHAGSMGPIDKLPSIHVRTRPNPHSSPRLDVLYEEEKDAPIASPPSSPRHSMFLYPSDWRLTPPTLPPPPAPVSEPVLVPTEHYTPSKLGLTRAKDPHTQFGHSYWALNAFNSHAQAHEQEEDPPSSFTQAPLYSFTEPYHDDHELGVDDIPPSYAGSGSGSISANISDMRNSASTSRTPDHYLTPHMHKDGYATNGLSSFATLEEGWVSAPDRGPVPGMDMDMPPTQMEGVSRAVHSALSASGMQGGTY